MPLQKSWVTSANSCECQFPLKNVPYGVFSVGGSDARCGIAIGDFILDLTAAQEVGLLAYKEANFEVPYWNDFM